MDTTGRPNVAEDKCMSVVGWLDVNGFVAMSGEGRAGRRVTERHMARWNHAFKIFCCPVTRWMSVFQTRGSPSLFADKTRLDYRADRYGIGKQCMEAVGKSSEGFQGF